MSALISVVDVFVSTTDPLMQFLYGLLWGMNLLLVSLYLPYDSLARNVQNVLVGFATLAHSAIFLAVQHGGANSNYMMGLMSIFALILLILLFREKLAVGVPWLKVVRRTDMKKQEEIIQAAAEFERVLDLAVALTNINPMIQRSRSNSGKGRDTSHSHSGQHFRVRAHSLQLTTADTSPLPLTLQLDKEYERELKAEAAAAAVQSHSAVMNHAEREVSGLYPPSSPCAAAATAGSDLMVVTVTATQ